MKKKVSIITTFYNDEVHLQYSLNSVANQSFDSNEIDVEYIIVDDNSTDNSHKIAEDIVNDVFNKTYIEAKLLKTPENLGCGGARKFGIDNATGDYFMFLDADDYYLRPDFVYRAYNDIVSLEADIVEYGVVVNEPKVSKRRASAAPHQIVITNKEEALFSLIQEAKIRFSVWNKIYTADIVHSYPYDTTRTYEDIRTMPFWVANASKIVIQPTVEVNWRANNKSIIRNNAIETRVGTCKALCELCESFKDNYVILKALYTRAMIDFRAALDNRTSNDPGFNEISKYNTKMLSYLYPEHYQEFTYNIEGLEN